MYTYGAPVRAQVFVFVFVHNVIKYWDQLWEPRCNKFLRKCWGWGLSRGHFHQSAIRIKWVLTVPAARIYRTRISINVRLISSTLARFLFSFSFIPPISFSLIIAKSKQYSLHLIYQRIRQTALRCLGDGQLIRRANKQKTIPPSVPSSHRPISLVRMKRSASDFFLHLFTITPINFVRFFSNYSYVLSDLICIVLSIL